MIAAIKIRINAAVTIPMNPAIRGIDAARPKRLSIPKACVILVQNTAAKP